MFQNKQREDILKMNKDTLREKKEITKEILRFMARAIRQRNWIGMRLSIKLIALTWLGEDNDKGNNTRD